MQLKVGVLAQHVRGPGSTLSTVANNNNNKPKKALHLFLTMGIRGR